MLPAIFPATQNPNTCALMDQSEDTALCHRAPCSCYCAALHSLPVILSALFITPFRQTVQRIVTVSCRQYIGLGLIYSIILGIITAQNPRVRRAFISKRSIPCYYLAENGGFEPPEACTSIDFKSTAIDHSANSPLKRAQL